MEGGELTEQAPRAVVRSETKSEPGERTDDPVRMYLREMGSVELLSREGEIAIAKRIEAGREAMIAGLCESPLTFQAIIIWRDELTEGGCCCATSSTWKPPMPAPRARTPPAMSRARRRSPPRRARTAFSATAPCPMTTKTTWRNSLSLAAMELEIKRRLSRPSTALPTATRSCAACRTRMSNPS